MYPTPKNPQASTRAFHGHFALQDWTPAAFADHQDALLVAQFTNCLSTIVHAVHAAIHTYTMECRSFLGTEIGRAMLESTQKDLIHQLSHTEMGISESTCSANVQRGGTSRIRPQGLLALHLKCVDTKVLNVQLQSACGPTSGIGRYDILRS